MIGTKIDMNKEPWTIFSGEELECDESDGSVFVSVLGLLTITSVPGHGIIAVGENIGDFVTTLEGCKVGMGVSVA